MRPFVLIGPLRVDRSIGRRIVFLLLALSLLGACTAEALLPDPPGYTAPTASTSVEAPPTSESSPTVTAESTHPSSSSVTSSSSEPIQCTGLFGRPGPSTGLGPDECGPSCQCGDATWTAPDYDESDLLALRSWTLVNPPDVPTTDPFRDPDLWVEQPDRVCAFLPEDAQDRTYRLETMDSEAQALDAGGRVTHEGACGLCSSLEDLAVYIGTPELTTPVRACGLLALQEGEEESLQCIRDLGFTDACAQIWFHNTIHTRRRCARDCLRLLEAPHNQPDGSLNACLQCDEDQSGPVFKGASGRTRRNSGLPSGICRPCGTDIAALVHEYP